jgi:NlpC/P60 family putative phage cell wall peptidase
MSPFEARVVAEAMSWLRTPYRHQASVKGQGTDCLGLVRGVYRALHGREPEVAPPYPKRLPTGSEPLLSAARRCLLEVPGASTGSVVLFRLRRHAPVSHCGIVLPEGRFIHAFEGRGVIVTGLSDTWLRSLAAAFAIPEMP